MTGRWTNAESFDVAIVGGGAAGCVLARRLAESGDRSVLLLEGGPDLRARTPRALRDGWGLPIGEAWPFDWGFESEPKPGTGPQKLRRGRLLGGTSWLTRFAVRGADTDFDAWAAAGNSGWAFEDVLTTFRGIEADAEFGHEPWHGDRGPIPVTRYPDLERSAIHTAALEAFSALGFPMVTDHNHPHAVGVGPMPMNTRAGKRVTTVDAYLPADRELANLSIRPDSVVANVRLDKARAVGVRLIDGSEIRAREVILAAGVYGSPAILMRSGVGPADDLRAADIETRVDLPGVGRNLADHPGVDLDSGWRGSAPSGPILHSIATFRSAMAGPEGPPDMMFWVSDPAGDEPAFFLDPILLKPRSRGLVRLRSPDPSDAPIITLPGIHEAEDLRRLAEGYERGLELANRPEIRDLAENAAPRKPASAAELRRRVAENVYSIPHVVGTCAMGPSPEEGAVVDRLGQVHGVDGLRVIDASIIPEPPSGFPHLVTIMVAEHLAKKLAVVR